MENIYLYNIKLLVYNFILDETTVEESEQTSISTSTMSTTSSKASTTTAFKATKAKKVFRATVAVKLPETRSPTIGDGNNAIDTMGARKLWSLDVKTVKRRGLDNDSSEPFSYASGRRPVNESIHDIQESVKNLTNSAHEIKDHIKNEASFSVISCLLLVITLIVIHY